MPARRFERAEPTLAHQIEVTPDGSRPPIWRRLRVPGDTTLHALHPFLQRATGWNDTHLCPVPVGCRQFVVEPTPGRRSGRTPCAAEVLVSLFRRRPPVERPMRPLVVVGAEPLSHGLAQ